MPIYEYLCNGCGRQASLFFRSFSTPVEPVCPSCKGTDLRRLMSKVAVLKNTDQRLAKLDEYARYMAEAADPRDAAEVERWAKRVGGELDEELGSGFRQMADQITGDDERPYDLFDPRGTLELALEKRRAELMGWEQPRDMWDEAFEGTPSGEAPSFVQEAREKGTLPDGSPFVEG